MNGVTVCPDESHWERLLDSQQPDTELTAWLDHLETCPTCRERLERMAAGGIPWRRVAQLLNASGRQPAEYPLPLVAAMRKLEDQMPPPLATEQPETSPNLPPNFLEPAPQPGRLGCLDDYEVFEEVGRGAMGVVLRAFDPKLHRVVAIKVMSPQLASFPRARQRFVREGHSAAAVCHENVVAVHAIGERLGLPYLVMQFVAGKTLQQRLDQTGPLQVAEILRIGMQAAAGLAAAHAQGLVHRDIKPANLLLENGVERVKLTDFGLARAVDDASITQTGTITGTPQYMAPEQARGEAVDARSDLFSLGCVLYALCTGRPPFRGSAPLAVLKRVCEVDPTPIRELNPEIPDWLAGIVVRLMAKAPDQRWSSASELSLLLAQCLEHWQHAGRVPLPLAAVASPHQVAASSPVSFATRGIARWTARLGIVAIIAATILPLSIVAVNRWMDRRFGPTPNVTTESSPAPPPSVASPEVVAELDRIIKLADEQGRVLKGRYERGEAPMSEAIAAEVDLAAAKLRRARATGENASIGGLLAELVSLRQRQVEFAKALFEAGKSSRTDVLSAERSLSDARVELLEVRRSATEPQLVGMWQVLGLESNGRHAPAEIVSATKVIFADDMLIFVPGEPGYTRYRYRVNPTANPAQIDLIPEHGDGDGRQDTQLGIYTLDGGPLKICLRIDGTRPRDFSASAKSKQVLYILERPIDRAAVD